MLPASKSFSDEVAERFGLMPDFFRSASAAPARPPTGFRGPNDRSAYVYGFDILGPASNKLGPLPRLDFGFAFDRRQA